MPGSRHALAPGHGRPGPPSITLCSMLMQGASRIKTAGAGGACTAILTAVGNLLDNCDRLANLREAFDLT